MLSHNLLRRVHPLGGLVQNDFPSPPPSPLRGKGGGKEEIL